MKLALGTAQLGLDYGVSNFNGQVTNTEATRIFSLAKQLNINTLDTAQAYGNSEVIIGRLAPAESKIVTKVSLTSGFISLETIKHSLDQLQRNTIYGLLIHDSHNIDVNNISEIKKTLFAAKEAGVVNKIGMSLYHPGQTEIFKYLKPDIIQIPLNILDQRFLNGDLLSKLKERDIEIHSRSTFLQGLLLLPPDKRPLYFNQFEILRKIDKFIAEENFDRLTFFLQFLNQIEEVDNIVVGCCSSTELNDIYKAAQKIEFESGLKFASSNENLIIPSNWP